MLTKSALLQLQGLGWMTGTVCCWLPANLTNHTNPKTGKPASLWRVQLDNDLTGDFKDLLFEEVHDAVAQYDARQSIKREIESNSSPTGDIPESERQHKRPKRDNGGHPEVQVKIEARASEGTIPQEAGPLVGAGESSDFEPAGGKAGPVPTMRQTLQTDGTQEKDARVYEKVDFEAFLRTFSSETESDAEETSPCQAAVAVFRREDGSLQVGGNAAAERPHGSQLSAAESCSEQQHETEEVTTATAEASPHGARAVDPPEGGRGGGLSCSGAEALRTSAGLRSQPRSQRALAVHVPAHVPGHVAATQPAPDAQQPRPSSPWMSPTCFSPWNASPTTPGTSTTPCEALPGSGAAPDSASGLSPRPGDVCDKKKLVFLIKERYGPEVCQRFISAVWEDVTLVPGSRGPATWTNIAAALIKTFAHAPPVLQSLLASVPREHCYVEELPDSTAEPPQQQTPAPPPQPRLAPPPPLAALQASASQPAASPVQRAPSAPVATPPPTPRSLRSGPPPPTSDASPSVVPAGGAPAQHPEGMHCHPAPGGGHDCPLRPATMGAFGGRQPLDPTHPAMLLARVAGLETAAAAAPQQWGPWTAQQMPVGHAHMQGQQLATVPRHPHGADIAAAPQSQMMLAPPRWDPAAHGAGSTRLMSLDNLLMACSLGERVPYARQWFDVKGLNSLSDLVEAEMEDEFVRFLQLKEGRARILRKRLAEAAAL